MVLGFQRAESVGPLWFLLIQHFRHHFFVDSVLPVLLCLAALSRHQRRTKALRPQMRSQKGCRQ